nr:BspA family leucine-rich repeat surface protein [uncultured Campylobacter sp.]
MTKFSPKTKDELKALISDKSVYLGDIDTSTITDMSYLLFSWAKSFNQSLKTWQINKSADSEKMFELCAISDDNKPSCYENYNKIEKSKVKQWKNVMKQNIISYGKH